MHRRTLVAAVCAVALWGPYAVLAEAPPPSGEMLFQARCAGCHNGAAETRAPAPEVLRQRSPASILEVLANGSMRVQGASLSGPERRAIAEYLGGAAMPGDSTGAALGRCGTPSQFKFKSVPAWNGWGATLANTRAQSEASAQLSAAQLPRLELKWAFGFPDATSAWAQPTLVGGWVFVGSQNGTVFALDAKSGCIHWFFSADGGVRTAISVGATPSGGAVYFGDTDAQAYALDASSGRLLWKTKIEEHPLARITGAPTLYKDRVYVPMSSYEESQGARPEYGCCTFRGSLSAVDANTGKVIWRSYMIPDEPRPRGSSSAGVTLYGPAGAPIWSAPTIDARRGLIYVATGNTYAGIAAAASDAVVALELSGKIAWIKQLFPKDVFISGCRAHSDNPNCADQSGPDYDFGNSPILAELPQGRSVIVLGQKSGTGWALDPDKRGEVLWQYHAGAGGALGGIEWGSAVDAQHAYFAVSDIFSPAPGGLHAVNLKTGERAWYAPPPAPRCTAGPRCSAAQAAAISVIPGAVFSGSNDGTLRAYSTQDGAILWEVDTDREFQTLNGVPARGASMLGPGPIIAGGMLYVPSGYGAFGGRPGNVLLAYGLAVDTRK
ncbi:MAG: PQQ-binding-like beta-propeller repeat protein [Steroidobacteraceae bacterium]